MKLDKGYVIGVDFGSDSVRAVLVDSMDGSTIATKTYLYKRWSEEKYCNFQKSQYRQHLRDHIEGMESVILSVLTESKVDPNTVLGIGLDTTGSSPLPVNRDGDALCLTDEFAENPNSMVILWKDHSAIREAEEINSLSHSWGGTDYTKYVGGVYSAEWFWAKILYISRIDNSVKENAHSWVEHCDYMTSLLTGNKKAHLIMRSRCAAGHKAMWHDEWSGLPSDEFFERLDPYLVQIKHTFGETTYTSDSLAGNLSTFWAEKFGLSTNVKVSVGTFDAHAGALGAEVKEGTLVRVMGTSTCDIIVTDPGKTENVVKGICGQVSGSVLPDMIGLEAGQSGFGDTLAWFVKLLSWPLTFTLDGYKEKKDEITEKIFDTLSHEASELPISDRAPLALDWINGRRTPDANHNLKAGMLNLGLDTDAPNVFRALVEAICFGSKAIINRFIEEGIQINEIVAIGGVAKKSEFVMQTLSDVLATPIKVAASNQAPALGAAMYAAIASGVHPNTEIAIKRMGQGFEKHFTPIPKNSDQYEVLFRNYLKLASFVESGTGSDSNI